MGDYRSIINRQALNVLTKIPDVPDFRLMVGNAEELHSLPILVFADYMPANTSAILPKTSELTYEEVQAQLATGKLSIDDFFTNTFPLGNPTEGV